MDNQTTMTYFTLVQFSNIRLLQLLHFFSFFVLYLTTVIANLLIISAVAYDHQLHTPMYFFLMNLAMTDLGSISVIVPKSMVNSLMDIRDISYFGCVAQVFIFLTFAGTDFSLLTVMAYDRYVAICNPLHYEMVMNRKACTEIMIVVWVTSLLYGTLHASGIFSISFCSNDVNQFFCEIPQLLKLSCSGMHQVEDAFLVASIIAVTGCFTFMIVSYVMIFKTVWKIPSVEGRQKAFSTCVPHLAVVSIFLFTGMLSILRPPSNSHLDIAITVIYSLVPPLFNPVIYSIRNSTIKSVLSKMLGFRNVLSKFRY